MEKVKFSRDLFSRHAMKEIKFSRIYFRGIETYQASEITLQCNFVWTAVWHIFFICCSLWERRGERTFPLSVCIHWNISTVVINWGEVQKFRYVSEVSEYDEYQSFIQDPILRVSGSSFWHPKVHMANITSLIWDRVRRDHIPTGRCYCPAFQQISCHEPADLPST